MLYLQEYIQQVGDLVLPCNTFRILVLSDSNFLFTLYHSILCFNPLPDDKILDCSKLKQIADNILKVTLQILRKKFYKNLKKSSQSLLIFIHKIPVVKNHPTTREIRELLLPRSKLMGITVYFYTSSSFIYILEIHLRKFQT